jgi:PKD repeat protein
LQLVGSPTAGSAPLTVNFTDNSTGTITIARGFGDGSGTNTSLHIAYTYNVGGIHSVSLTARGPRDTNTMVRANYVSATDVAPSAFHCHSHQWLRPPGVQFTDISTGTITNRFWDFGDGSTTNTVEAQIRFYSAGTYRKTNCHRTTGSNSKQRNNYISVTNARQTVLLVKP